MASCGGGWAGDGSGTWTGTVDDSNLIALQRETAGVCNDTSINVADIKNQVFGSYGFEASWDLLHGMQLDWSAWVGVSHTGHDYTWAETARQVDGVNELVVANRVDLHILQQTVESIQTQLTAVQTTCNAIAFAVDSVMTIVAGIRDSLVDFRDGVYKRLIRSIGAISEVVNAAFMPLYRLCRASRSASSRLGSVSVDKDLLCTSNIVPRVSDPVVSSFSDDSGLYIEAWELSDYGLFHPLVGDSELFYSSELRQVISRPYRNSGQVYLG